MYAKIYSSMFDGTLATVGPWEAIVTFQQMLILCEPDGTIDMTAEVLSRRTTIPLDIILTGISALLRPDEKSRTPDEDGRRIIALHTERDWGWKIVNYGKYRSFKTPEEKREYMREYMREYRKSGKSGKSGKPELGKVTHADADADANIKAVPRKRGPSARKVSPKTPLPADFSLDEELRLYAVDRLPGVNGPALWESFRGKALAKGWEYANWRQAWQEFVRNSATNSGHFAAGQYPKASAERGAVC